MAAVLMCDNMCLGGVAGITIVTVNGRFNYRSLNRPFRELMKRLFRASVSTNKYRDRSGYDGPGQWEEALLCNASSYWSSLCPESSLQID